jgi:hypothetical protein
MELMKRMLDQIGFSEAVVSCGLPQPDSNRGMHRFSCFCSSCYQVWCGANRFEQTEVTRHNSVLKKLFGFKRMASFEAIIQLFKKFNQSMNTRVFGNLYRWFFWQSSR